MTGTAAPITPSAPSPRPRTAPTGLTAADVAERVADGLTNDVEERTSRTVGEIIRANVLTRFNAILGSLAVVVIATGRYLDALFALVLVFNAAMGIGQELRAKRTLDRLALMHAPTARVLRDGELVDVQLGEVVLDDIVELRSGDQVAADGEVVSSDGLEIDESALTGESDPVHKSVGDAVMSGTIVVAGTGRFQAGAVGADSYARRLAAEVKAYSRAESELQNGINRLLGWISKIIVLVAPLLLWAQFRSDDTDTWQEPVVASAAAIVGMIPDGLVLLTSLSFLVAAVTLARRQVLVQELPAVEGLARVDVVCLDKTGTLTSGEIAFDALEPLDGADEPTVTRALGALADDPNANGTMLALGAAFDPPDGWERNGTVPFSSARKWSAASFGEHGVWFMGAPDVLLDDGDPLRAEVNSRAGSGRRVLLLQHDDGPLDGETLPASRRSVALVTLAEQIRPDARDTLDYFRSQDVAIKVISGDNPVTVGAIATSVGLDVGDPVDALEVGDQPEDLVELIEERTVFGRVSPHQKRAMVRALQSKAHVVAMTGDGVNDAMALKDSDIGVAMGSGTQATRAAAQLVLLDDRFAHLPSVLAEGRRVINNIERVASLFIVKNSYSLLLVLLTSVTLLPYPFLPRHLTLISAVSIGIPAFFLALGPNPARYQPGFLRRVLTFSVPTGVVTGLAVFAAYGVARAQDVTQDQARTDATIAALVVTLWILAVLARPFVWWKTLLVGAMVALAVGAVAIPFAQDVFEFDVVASTLPWALLIGAAGAVVVELVHRLAAARASG